jgi:hypothetical protein
MVIAIDQRGGEILHANANFDAASGHSGFWRYLPDGWHCPRSNLHLAMMLAAAAAGTRAVISLTHKISKAR